MLSLLKVMESLEKVSILIQIEVATLLQSLISMLLIIRIMGLSKVVERETKYIRRTITGEADERL